jgi:hypothetical protein
LSFAQLERAERRCGVCSTTAFLVLDWQKLFGLDDKSGLAAKLASDKVIRTAKASG